jgi:hypothetical protein
MRTIQTTVYKFSELSESAQNRAHEKWVTSDYPIDLDFTLDQFTELLEMIGFSNIEIYYSGFHSQGDGASFTGRYTYKKGFLKAVKSEWGNTELHAILDRLQELQGCNFYRLESDIYQRGGYVHENTMYDVNDDTFLLDRVWRPLARWMYSVLEKDYEYQTSFEAFSETAGACEWEFTDNGVMV